MGAISLVEGIFLDEQLPKPERLLIAADYLEEEGDERRARGLRRMGARGKWPKHAQDTWNPDKPWRWQRTDREEWLSIEQALTYAEHDALKTHADWVFSTLPEALLALAYVLGEA